MEGHVTPKTILGTVAAPISWGTTYVTVTEFLPPGRPLTLAALRVLPAGLLLIGVGWLRSRWRPRGREWRQHATIALFNFGLFFPLLIVATYRLPGGIVGAGGGLQPLFVALLTLAIVGRRPALRDTAVGLAAALGTAMVVWRTGAAFDAIGVVATVAATLSFAAAVVLTKHYPAPADRIAATGWQLTLSATVLVPLAWLVEGLPPAPAPREFAGFAYLSLAATGVAFVLWFSGIQRLPSTAPPLLGLAAPLTGVTVGWVALGQALTATQLAGFGITLAAIAIGVTRRPVEVVDSPVVTDCDPEVTGCAPVAA
ncbi:MAG TPA: DMT family transporter [Acidimicrobiia bacterium]|nr:DMT family transporter [Acidimicrobiia bacterium]